MSLRVEMSCRFSSKLEFLSFLFFLLAGGIGGKAGLFIVDSWQMSNFFFSLFSKWESAFLLGSYISASSSEELAEREKCLGLESGESGRIVLIDRREKIGQRAPSLIDRDIFFFIRYLVCFYCSLFFSSFLKSRDVFLNLIRFQVRLLPVDYLQLSGLLDSDTWGETSNSLLISLSRL